MDNRTLILLFTCFVPLFTAVVGTIIEAISLQDSVTVRETHVKRMLMCYFLMFIFIGTGVATGVALPKIAIQILPLTVFSLYIAPVLYYRFVYLLTNTENKETSHFSRHYLFPVLSALGFCAFFYIVPARHPPAIGGGKDCCRLSGHYLYLQNDSVGTVRPCHPIYVARLPKADNMLPSKRAKKCFMEEMVPHFRFPMQSHHHLVGSVLPDDVPPGSGSRFIHSDCRGLDTGHSSLLPHLQSKVVALPAAHYCSYSPENAFQGTTFRAKKR